MHAGSEFTILYVLMLWISMHCTVFWKSFSSIVYYTCNIEVHHMGPEPYTWWTIICNFILLYCSYMTHFQMIKGKTSSHQYTDRSRNNQTNGIPREKFRCKAGLLQKKAKRVNNTATNTLRDKGRTKEGVGGEKLQCASIKAGLVLPPMCCVPLLSSFHPLFLSPSCVPDHRTS